MTLILTVFLKPFVALLILVPIRMFTEWLRVRMPEGRLKQVLFSPLSRESRSRG